jgi:hypothetical protein
MKTEVICTATVQCAAPLAAVWTLCTDTDRFSNTTVATVGPEAIINIHNPAPYTPNWSASTGPTAPPLPATCWPCRCTRRTSPPPSPPASPVEGRGHACARAGARRLALDGRPTFRIPRCR